MPQTCSICDGQLSKVANQRCPHCGALPPLKISEFVLDGLGVFFGAVLAILGLIEGSQNGNWLQVWLCAAALVIGGLTIVIILGRSRYKVEHGFGEEHGER